MTTRRRKAIINNYEELTPYFDSPSEDSSSSLNEESELNSNKNSSISDEEDLEMSDAPTTHVDNNTNPFANAIIIGDKVGNSLFSKATAGLSDDEKLNLDIEHARLFKDEMDNANANFV